MITKKTEPQGDNKVVISGTSVQFTAPEGFEPANSFAGLFDRQTGSTIHVVELPTPTVEIRGGMTKYDLLAQGMSWQSNVDLIIADCEASLLVVTQDVEDVSFGKQIVVFGNDERTVLITATYPVDANAVELLGQTLRTATWTPTPANLANDLAHHPFELSAIAPLTKQRVIGRNLTLTVDDSKHPRRPYLVAGWADVEVLENDHLELAATRLARTAAVSDVQLESAEGGGRALSEQLPVACAASARVTFVGQPDNFGQSEQTFDS